MGLPQDVRASFRLLAKNRGFAATAILTLALAYPPNTSARKA
jgi:hypothetical protein